jgi:hypothetical protein
MLAEASLDTREVIRNSDESHVERAATDAERIASEARGVDQKIQHMDRVQLDS